MNSLAGSSGRFARSRTNSRTRTIASMPFAATEPRRTTGRGDQFHVSQGHRDRILAGLRPAEQLRGLAPCAGALDHGASSSLRLKYPVPSIGRRTKSRELAPQPTPIEPYQGQDPHLPLEQAEKDRLQEYSNLRSTQRGIKLLHTQPVKKLLPR